MYTVIETEICQHCSGTGSVYQPHCSKCAASVSEEFMTSQIVDAKALPCGHAVRHLQEYVRCSYCHGEGEIIRQVDLEAALRELGIRRSPPKQGER